MVGCSDLAWRLLLRRHGADLCYTEMLYSERFVADPEYRARKLQTCADDAPLVVQFCGTDPETLAEAARLAAPHCAAVDLNLGCPLPQACESGFGAYLLDVERRGLLLSLVAAMRAAIALPLCCKIRLLPTVEATVALCRELQSAGCDLIAVHGRHCPPPHVHRAARLARSAADLEAVRAVAAAVSVPVLSNGNTESPCDIATNLAATGAAGVMSGEGVLRNPLLFDAGGAAGEPSRQDLGAAALEYLELARAHPPPASVLRSHMMWLLGRSGKSRHASFRHLGPFSAQQLWCALVEAETPDEHEGIVRATLLA